jgi:hypothetical protein
MKRSFLKYILVISFTYVLERNAHLHSLFLTISLKFAKLGGVTADK